MCSDKWRLWTNAGSRDTARVELAAGAPVSPVCA